MLRDVGSSCSSQMCAGHSSSLLNHTMSSWSCSLCVSRWCSIPAKGNCNDTGYTGCFSFVGTRMGVTIRGAHTFGLLVCTLSSHKKWVTETYWWNCSAHTGHVPSCLCTFSLLHTFTSHDPTCLSDSSWFDLFRVMHCVNTCSLSVFCSLKKRAKKVEGETLYTRHSNLMLEVCNLFSLSHMSAWTFLTHIFHARFSVLFTLFTCLFVFL